MSLELRGLRCDMPVGFMAGLGLLRVAPPHARLSWSAETQTAIIHGMEREALLDCLLQHMTGRSKSPELHMEADVRGLSSERFRELAETHASDTLQWVRALWWEKGDDVIPTGLCFTSGPQRMILMAQRLAAALDPSGSSKAQIRVQAKFEEALFGPWLYADDTPSWGWDPASYRIGAQTHQAPTIMPNEGVSAAYWLAWEALPLLPCIPGRGTLGFVKENRVTKWTWASWSEPLPLAAVEALLRRPREAVTLGGRMFESDVVKSGYYQFFRPARFRVA